MPLNVRVTLLVIQPLSIVREHDHARRMIEAKPVAQRPLRVRRPGWRVVPRIVFIHRTRRERLRIRSLWVVSWLAADAAISLAECEHDSGSGVRCRGTWCSWWAISYTLPFLQG